MPKDIGRSARLLIEPSYFLLGGGVIMTYLKSSPSQRGCWQLGEHELKAGDIIEVRLLDTWGRAVVRYEASWGEYQLLVNGCPCSLALLEGHPAIWLGNETIAHGPINKGLLSEAGPA
jgi:hypothetical protein